MRALILTNEFPPHVYGGAGVHVDYLTRELRKLIEVEVRSFAGAPADEDGWRVRAYEASHAVDAADPMLKSLWATLSRDIGFVADPIRTDQPDHRARAIRHRPTAPVCALRGPRDAPEGDHPPGPRHPEARSGDRGRTCGGPAGHARDRRRDGKGRRRGSPSSSQRDLDSGDARPGGQGPALQPRGCVLLP